MEPAIKTNFVHEKIAQSISKGIDYLYQHQYPHGEFCVYISGDDSMQGWNHPDSSNFGSVLIGSSLLFLKEDPKVKEMLKKTAAFLRYQMARGGTWHHYTNLHYLRPLCPLDVDDTSCISHFLQQQNVDFPKADNKALLLANRRKDGLFYTWFTFRLRMNSNRTYWRIALKEFIQPVKSLLFWRSAECSRYDVDAIVNANVLYYLGDVEATQPIIELLTKVIEEGKEADCDKWYINPFTAYYFISRNYYAGITKLEAIRKKLIDRILSKFQDDGSFGESVADTALAVCSLMNLKYSGTELQAAIAYLIKSQKNTGEWERRRIYYMGPTKTVGTGSEELTTAFCLEALQRYCLSNM
jgi:hypothetical protein